ncbi:Rrf2 family transcriptional regulator [Xanthobacter sp. NM-25]|nr:MULTISPECIES: Rrf2 family transcriptional regulator [unclassified Xanthobacter]
MYFTRQTEIAVSILSLCARAPETYVTKREMADHAQASAGTAARVAATLAQRRLLRSRHDGSVQLAVDPREVTLAQILSITQPGLAWLQEERSVTVSAASAFHVVVEAGYRNLLHLAERYTVADFASEPRA